MSPTRRLPPLLLLLFLLLLPRTDAQSNPTFNDVTVYAGIQDTNLKRTKYGGPTVADLDADGYPDLLFVHHDSSWMEVYFNLRNGRFTKSPFRLWTDMHGINVSPRSPYNRARVFSVSSGGNYGKDPKPPRLFQVTPARTITEITAASGITVATGGRGRSAVFMHLKNNPQHRFPDLLLTNARATNRPNHFAYANYGGATFSQRFISGFAYRLNAYAMPADIDNDGKMDLVAYQELTMYKLVAPFTLRDVTAAVLPAGTPRSAVVSIVEFDYNNDGKMDLYVARSNTGDLSWHKGTYWPDLLLENRGGTYVDVAKRAGLPASSLSRGACVGDFNNDGYTDIYVAQYFQSDLILLNRGDGTFKQVRGLIFRPQNVRGDNAACVDYDLDGRVDLVVSQGDSFNKAWGGSYRIRRNVTPRSKTRRYLLVRVGNAPDRSATSLHAIVTVTTGKLKQTKRVGSTGDTVARSFLETVHFGLGKRKRADSVTVKWTSGATKTLSNVKSNSKITVGLV